ncbi:MAG TPA: hypothetical protein VH637_10990 [Streptosporangiaceae bacterium]
MDESRHQPGNRSSGGPPPEATPDRPPGDGGAGPGAELSPRELPAEVAELVGEISEDTSPSRRRRVSAAIARLARRSSQATRYGARSGTRWLTAEVLAMAPRIPVRDRDTLRAQFPGAAPEELADALIHGAARSSMAVGAAAGMSMVLPLPAMPVEVVVETLAMVGIEIKLVAELHEVYGMRPSGPVTERTMAYVSAWANRRGVSLAPAGIVVAVGSPLRRRLQRRLLVRAGRSAVSVGPLLTGAVAGAALNRRETHRLGGDVRDDLRRRSPHGADWPD